MIMKMNACYGGHISKKIPGLEVPFWGKPKTKAGNCTELIKQLTIYGLFVHNIQENLLRSIQVWTLNEWGLILKWKYIPKTIPDPHGK